MAGWGAWRREAVQARCDEIGIRLQGVILKLLAKASIKLVLAPCTQGPRTPESPDPGPGTQTLDPLEVESNLESSASCLS